LRSLTAQGWDSVMIRIGIQITSSAACAIEMRLSLSHTTGKERDAESGLDYFGARYYGSNMGRWMSPDWSAKEDPVPYAKLDNPQSLNLYGYVLNNPLGDADPDGHQTWAQRVEQAKQWVADHPRTVSAVKATVTAVATVGVVVAIVATAPVSVPATLGAAAVTGLTAAAAGITAAGGAVATVTYATGAITGDTKNTSQAAEAVQTVTNPVGMAVAVGTGGNMNAAGNAAAVSDLLTGGKDALTHVDKDVSAMGSAATAAVHAGGAATAVPAAATLASKPEKKNDQ